MYYKVSADGYSDKTGSATITINKANPTVTAPTEKTLTYNGSAQDLLTAGTVTGGTMYYALGNNATTAPTDGYGADIPKGTDDGTYYVWYKVSGDINHKDTTAQCVQVTITLESYTISYSGLAGSSGASGNPTSYTMKSPDITLSNPSKNGYDFTGWTGTDLTAKTQTVTIPKGSTGNRNYTANFSPIVYTISYELNGGTNDADNPTSYTIESATITLKAPTRNGYDFGGWTLNGEAISEIVQGSIGDRTLTATWGETKPVISPDLYVLTVYKGQSSSLTLNATGTNLEWSMSGNLPAGMTFSNAENSATISGTPELGTSGTYVVTVTAKNAGGSASAEITVTVTSDFALSGDVEIGTPATTTLESGGSQTTTQTVFRNGAGQTILTADVAITTESEDFKAIAGSAFTTKVKVDAKLNWVCPRNCVLVR